jgi:parallel beta-helix repeat protein
LAQFLLSLLAALVLSLSTAPAVSAAEEGGIDITSDTVWEGALDLTGEVRVHKGATLLIQPGTTLRFSGKKDEDGKPKSRLMVHGALVAQGTQDEPILFTSAATHPERGDWGGIVFERANETANRLQYSVVEYAVEGIRGAYSTLLLADSELRHNETGLSALRDLKGGLIRCTVRENERGALFHQSSGMSIDQSRFEGNSASGIVCVFASSPSIRHSTISGNGKVGVSCLQGASPVIRDNVITGHERGVHVELKSRPTIVSNIIEGNGTGIWVIKLAFPRVADNTITGNGVGIYCNYSGYPEIHGNNITGNERFGLVLGDNMSIVMEKQIPFRDMGQFSFEPFREQPGDIPEPSRKFTPFTASDEGIVDARGNWWGLSALKEMEEHGEGANITVIEDFHDKPDTWYKGKSYRRDRVAFSSWETEPLSGSGPSEVSFTGVKGKVIYREEPLGGVRVHVYRDAEDGFRSEGYAYSAPSGKGGEFSLSLRPGTYYLVAKRGSPPFPGKNPETDDYFGYYGGNPVTVTSDVATESNIQVVRRRERSSTLEARGHGAVIKGVVSGPEGPLEGASIHVYSDTTRQFRGPGLFGPQGAVIGGTDPEGRFAIDLPAGTYYLVASKRKGGGFLGPLRPGDLHGWYDGNPVVVRPGIRMSVTLQVVEKLKETIVPHRTGGGATAIKGKVSDPEGNVPAGVYAYATTDSNFMIGAMPPYRSQPLSKDGTYVIDLPEGGTYYVGARSGYGGPPLPGEWHGFLGGDALSPVTVETGKIREGADFTVRMME